MNIFEIFLTPSRFAYAILAADELVAVSNTIKFRYDDGITFLNWPVGEKVDNAVWISLFLVLVTLINMFPVRVSIKFWIYMKRVADLSPRFLESSNTFLAASRSRSSLCLL